MRLLAEHWLASAGSPASELRETFRDHSNAALECAAEYGNAGLWDDGIALLTLAADSATDKSRVSQLIYYFLGQFAEAKGDLRKAADSRNRATEMSPEYVFPFQWEAIEALRRAMEMNRRDARAPYYLGNLLFDWQPEEAAKLCEQSAALEPSFPIAHRNLAVAFAHQQPMNDLAKAVAKLEKAVSQYTKYAVHFAELDELYASTGVSPEKRLAALEQNSDVVLKRDDSLSRLIGMKVFAGKYDAAVKLMTGRKFSVWEGGTLDVADHWVNAHLFRGQVKLKTGQFAAALEDFKAAKTIPDNLPSDRRGGGGRDAEFAYLTGAAWEGLGDLEKARQSWHEAAALQAGGRGRVVARAEAGSDGALFPTAVLNDTFRLSHNGSSARTSRPVPSSRNW